MGNFLRRNRHTGEDLIEVPADISAPYRLVVPNHLLPDDLNPNEHPNRTYDDNKIETTKYTMWTFLPKNLFEQFHRVANMYFLFIVCLNWVPTVNAFAKELTMLPLMFVLGVTAIKDGFEDYRRYKSDKRVNMRTCRVYSRKERRYVRTVWQKICVGDFVHLSCNEIIPADMLLLRSSDEHGVCYIETANLDGETNLKQRESVKGMTYDDDTFHPVKFRGKVECDLPNTQIYRFSGSIIQPTGTKVTVSKSNILLRECVVRNTDFIEGIVLYAGRDTKALLNNKGSSYKQSRLEKDMNKDVIWSVVILVLTCGSCALGSAIWQSGWEQAQPFIPYYNTCRKEPWCEGFLVFWSFVIIFQVLIPLSLYVSVELIKMGQVYFIQNDLELYDHVSDRPIECRAWNITEDLGQIQYIFCDKTGTLTENKMVFKRCTIGGRDYLHSESDGSQENGAVSNNQAHNGHAGKAVNRILQQEVANMTLISVELDDRPPDNAEQSARIQDFFLAICLCNTVVVSRPHRDVMDDSGYILHDDLDDSITQDSLGDQTILNGTKKRPGSNASALSDATLLTRYEAESPDELTLVKAACAYGCQLLRRSSNHVRLWLPLEGEVDCDVLHMLHFNAARQCMSVIIRHPLTQEIILYCKGADVKIMDNLVQRRGDKDNARIIEETQKYIQTYAESGLRTLCMAKRTLSKEVYEEWLVRWTAAERSVENCDELLNKCAIEIETELELIGATGTEDCLQEGVPQTIASLRQAGMKVWMITGDKQETAVNIAHSCKLLTQNQLNFDLVADNASDAVTALDTHIASLTLDNERHIPEAALIIEGKTLSLVLHDQVASDKFVSLAEMCTSVVCCRTTPRQKAAVVGLIKDKLNKVTLAVGDGANDVNMILTANVGIGISGLEGIQAAMASDFAIARFKFLEKLLLVHGHWCYDRLAAMISYNFYKSCVFIFILFWYQLFNGFSGSVMIDQYYLLLFNICFTTLGPIIQGIFDQDVKANTLLQNPALYKQGPECKVYTRYTYWVNITDALWQSLVLYFIPHLAYADSDMGIWEFGTTCVSACVVTALAHNGLEFRSWTWYHLLSILGSWAVFIIFGAVFNAVCFPCSKPSDPFWVMEMAVTDPKFWLITLLGCVVALLPRITIRAMINTLNPSSVAMSRVNDQLCTVYRQPLVDEDDPPNYSINGRPQTTA